MINQQIMMKLQYNSIIKYVSNSTIEFTDEFLKEVSNSCKSISDVSVLLQSKGISR